jgi:hypothetical protein
MKLKDLCGTRRLTSVWAGHRYDSSVPRPVIDDETDHGAYPSHRAVCLGLDGVGHLFDQFRIDTQNSGLNAINATASTYPADIASQHPIEFAKVDLVIEVRYLKDDEHEILYATDEKTGLVVFEIGTHYHNHNHRGTTFQSFMWQWKPEGFLPDYLEPIDDNPPVEIKGKRPPEPKKLGPGRGRASAKAGAKLPPLNPKARAKRAAQRKAADG